MASRQWLKDNPKVLGYVSKTVHQHLQGFSIRHNVSVSRALTLILEEYFELEPDFQSSPDDVRRDTKIEILEQELENLRAKVDELTHQLSEKQQGETKSTQSGRATQGEQTPKPFKVREFKIRREGAEVDNQTQPSDEARKQTKDSPSFFDAPPQDPPSTNEKIPIHKTTPMPRRRKLGTDNPLDRSRNQSIASNRKHQSDEQGSLDSNTEGSSKGLLGRLGSFSRKLGSSNTGNSSTSRPALPPPADS
jgi:hypothetical protein